MSVEIACTCDGLPPHSHTYELVMEAGKILERRETGDVRIWVDWKAVARPDRPLIASAGNGSGQVRDE